MRSLHFAKTKYTILGKPARKNTNAVFFFVNNSKKIKRVNHESWNLISPLQNTYHVGS